MNAFQYRNRSDSDADLYCEDVNLSDLAEDFGTPLFVYSANRILENFREFNDALNSGENSALGDYISYAIKANSNPEILRLLAKEGAGAGVVSGGELLAAIAAGFAHRKITFDGPGKTDDEIRLALMDGGINAINVESMEELDVIDSIAREENCRARIAIRINPDVDAKSHPYISTGMKENKFGIDIADAKEAFVRATKLPSLQVVGIHLHIGSQITTTDPFLKAAQSVVTFVNDLKSSTGIALEHLNFGGGQGIEYKNAVRHPWLPAEPNAEASEIPPRSAFVKSVLPILKQTGLTIIFEPGRSLVADSGALLMRVLYTKTNKQKKFIIVDAGMTEMIRPSLYSAYQQVAPLHLAQHSPNEQVDVVGPICETSDFLAKGRTLPTLKRGDLAAVLCAGAYGFVLSSNYNMRTRPAEVLVDGVESRLVRERERLEDIVGLTRGIGQSLES